LNTKTEQLKELLILLKFGEKNDKEVKKLITSNKKIININLDPDLETADIDTSNNSWPKKQDESEFDKFKSKVKG
jgi:hypothetical protein